MMIRQKKKAARRNSGKGFTLIELLVVVAVIGIISALAVPNLQRAINRSRETATEAEIMKMIESVKLFKSDTEDCIEGYDADDFADWARENEYYKDLTLTDGWGNDYDIWLYCSSWMSGYEYVIIFSGGADGEIWTTDDVTYIYYPPVWDGWYSTGMFD